ncbi:fatty acid synthase-like [Sitophilus oryzae]|uniref:Fatty acid synthase n=1 Tax=Sitophilus oryzae TaxID=7048 RepID=A0A6J2YJM5_SITOR|nr:fatty acid synthase-like [Sitophilus oryzae]
MLKKEPIRYYENTCTSTYNTPKRTGKINGVENFDASFFGIPPRLANFIEPRHRIVFETVFEAMVDAGYNPKEFRGSNMGVFVGCSNFGAEEIYSDADNTFGYSAFGCVISQLANRISFCFDLKGPSFTIDTACSSSFYALANAVNAIESGRIDAAIVAAVNINFSPNQIKSFNLLNVLSKEGKSKVFSADRDGYVKSEAVVTILLQKKTACRRLYATVLGADVNCDGYKSEGISFPSKEFQSSLIKSVFESKNLNVNDVDYVEMHGTEPPYLLDLLNLIWDMQKYSVLGTNPLKEIQKYDTKKRPIWFIYSGMGSQWSGMGKDLMKLDVFRKTFKKCANALRPYNVDLEKVILSDDPSVLDDIVNCFSSIAAVSIALTDVLKSFGIEADYFAGHSLGETGCAYYNGGITAEQATLIGFARGYTTLQAKCKQNGQMAAVGLGKDECLSLLPEGVYIACVNGFKNVTVSGEKTKVKEFVEDLTNRGIFARLVPTANYAFHSKYVSEAVPILKDFVDKLIPNPKPRSPKWISSSWDEDDSENPLSKLNSGDYHAHNYGNTVFFDQVLKQIPKDAILIEVSPHALLTPILRRELGPDITYLSLANRNSQDNVQHLLSNIGK